MHECDKKIIYDKKENYWLCEEWDNGKLYLIVTGEDYILDSHGINVNFCPFCGYQPERLSEKTPQGDAIV